MLRATATLELPLAVSAFFFYEGASWRCVAVQQELGGGEWQEMEGVAWWRWWWNLPHFQAFVGPAVKTIFCCGNSPSLLLQVFLHQSLNCYSLKQSFLNFSMCQNHLEDVLKQISWPTSRVPDAVGQSWVGELSFAMSAWVMLVPPFWDHA